MRVLVVEDNSVLADGLQRGLVAEGYDVDVSNNGADGLWRAQEFPYDLVVLDILLPGMNGYEVCRTLRAHDVRTPVLMLTAKDGDHDEAEGLDLGADDYLRKPFAYAVLLARIRALLRRTDGRPIAETLAVGTLTIDFAERRCTVHERVIELTPREFSLLEAFARRRGVPLRRSELFDLVWGSEHPGMSNVVDVYVGYLRRKLDLDDTAAGRIETVRGIGYRMVA
jgi:two-component system, OmpR family, response regulator